MDAIVTDIVRKDRKRLVVFRTIQLCRRK